MLRFIKIFFVAMVAFFGLVSATMNLFDLQTAYGYVEGVTTMPSLTEAGMAPPWATRNPVVIWLGVILIVAGKLGALVFCSYGAYRMAIAAPEGFAEAKKPALFGMGLFLITLFGGFTIVGENVFYMWLTEDGSSAGEGAFRYGAMVALLMLIVGQEEPRQHP